MNSRTSRPRSPTSAITLIDALDRARDHAHQRGLADARAREDPEPLPAPARHEAVERAHAERDALADARPRQRVGRRRDRRARDPAGRRSAVVRRAEPVDHAPEQPVADLDAKRCARRQHPRAGPDAVQLAERHQQRASFPEAHDLGCDRRAVAVGSDHAHLADLRLQARRLDDQADQVRDIAVTAGEVRFAQRTRAPGQQRAGGRVAHAAGSGMASSASTTSRARSSCVRTLASSSPSDVRTIAPPRPTR